MKASGTAYRIFDHTADVGLEAYGRTLREAFANAAEGMFFLISGSKTVLPERTFRVHVEAPTPEELLVAWLNRLLYLHDAEKVLLDRFEIVKFENTGLDARVTGETIDSEKHRIRTYVKAATHHQAKVEIADPCKVRVIFDV